MPVLTRRPASIRKDARYHSYYIEIRLLETKQCLLHSNDRYLA